jgi:hypothetical protein
MLFLQLVDLFLVFLNERAELRLGSSATEPPALELFELLSFLLKFLALSDECVADGLQFCLFEEALLSAERLGFVNEVYYQFIGQINETYCSIESQKEPANQRKNKQNVQRCI